MSIAATHVGFMLALLYFQPFMNSAIAVCAVNIGAIAINANDL